MSQDLVGGARCVPSPTRKGGLLQAKSKNGTEHLLAVKKNNTIHHLIFPLHNQNQNDANFPEFALVHRPLLFSIYSQPPTHCLLFPQTNNFLPSSFTPSTPIFTNMLVERSQLLVSSCIKVAFPACTQIPARATDFLEHNHTLLSFSPSFFPGLDVCTGDVRDFIAQMVPKLLN